VRRAPRTNAAKFAVSGVEVVDVAFACQLELEVIAMNSLRSQAQLLLDIETTQHEKTREALMNVRFELNHARALLAEMKSALKWATQEACK
jgi:hypothetical protein